MNRVIAALLLVATAGFAQQTPPAPAAPRSATVPQPVEKTLANGMRVIVVSKHDVPLVSARLLVKAGAAEDAAGLEGLADLTASLLTKGTKTRTAEQIARGVEALGATLEAGAGWDSSRVDVTVMSPRFAEAMGFVADVVRNPAFKPEEIDRVRTQSIDALRVSMEEPMTIARYAAARVVFGGEPYGHSVSGTPESLERIQREQVAAFHRRYYRPENSIVIVSGDVKAAAVFATAEKLFGTWKKSAGTAAAPAAAPRPSAAKGRVVVIDMPEAGQAAVVVTRRGLSRTDPAYYRAIVANSILGGGYSARLNQEVRIKRGLSYGAYSSFDLRATPGPLSAWTQTKNESAAEVAGLMIDELNRFGGSGIGEEELVPRKAVLTGEFARSLETGGGIVDRISSLALYGLPLAEINKYIESVQAVTSAGVREFASANVGGEALNVIVAGDAGKFLDALKKRFATIEVIPIAELDVNRPELRKK